jgi:soluble lytic murein transglycosylase-like protein
MKKIIIAVALMLGGCTAGIDDKSIVTGVTAASANQNIVNLVTRKAIEHNIPVKFAHAIIHVESRHHANARHTSHYGLGQIKCGTARGIGFRGDCKQLLNPEINLEYSFKYLRMALDIAKDNECYAATLYQGGLGVRPRSSRYCKNVINKKALF